MKELRIYDLCHPSYLDSMHPLGVMIDRDSTVNEIAEELISAINDYWYGLMDSDSPWRDYLRAKEDNDIIKDVIDLFAVNKPFRNNLDLPTRDEVMDMADQGEEIELPYLYFLPVEV